MNFLSITSHKVASLPWCLCVCTCTGMTSGCVSPEAEIGWLFSLSPVLFLSFAVSFRNLPVSPALGLHTRTRALLLTWVIRTRIWVLMATQQVPYRPSPPPQTIFWSLSWLIASVCLASEVLKTMVFSYCQHCIFLNSVFNWHYFDFCWKCSMTVSSLWWTFCSGWTFYGFWHSEFLSAE